MDIEDIKAEIKERRIQHTKNLHFLKKSDVKNPEVETKIRIEQALRDELFDLSLFIEDKSKLPKKV